ncbi:hypothetical protein ACFPRL_15305 [Pseudoclavibacter helvolus]
MRSPRTPETRHTRPSSRDARDSLRRSGAPSGSSCRTATVCGSWRSFRQGQCSPSMATACQSTPPWTEPSPPPPPRSPR